jgi:glycosidase
MELLDFTKNCIRIRKEHAALRTGKFKTLYAHDDVMVYVCSLEDDQVLVAFNRSGQTRQVDLDVADVFPDSVDLKGELNIRTINVVAGKINGLSLAPFSGMIASRI